MDPTRMATQVWLMSQASVGSFVMYKKQLQQPSNAGNVLSSAAMMRKTTKMKNKKSRN
jgi:hypothetical protein